jgi:CelD/BcsL family acetyltransferase involved in cellulose biosynthesis
MRSTSAALQRRIAETTEAPAQPATPANPAPCHFEIVTARAGFDALATEWDDLFARAGRDHQGFQTFSWNWHWCNHYLGKPRDGGGCLSVLVGRRAGRLVMVWPLVTRRVAGVTQLTWMGAPVSQYGDVLIDDLPDALAILRAGWAHVIAATKPDLVSLPRVRADAAVAPLITELCALPTRRLQAPYLDLASAPDFETYMQRHSGRSRKKRRAAAKRLAEQGAKFVQHAKDATASQLAVDAIVSKRAQLLERGIISPPLADPRMRAFFADAAAAGAHSAGVTVYALEIDGERAAIDVLVACKDAIATHIFAYEPKYAKDRVGAYLLELTIAQAFADGRHTFDLLAPADDYKLRWADGTIDVTDWAVPVSAKGTAYARLYLQTLRPLAKSALNALPAALTRYLAAGYARLRSLS